MKAPGGRRGWCRPQVPSGREAASAPTSGRLEANVGLGGERVDRFENMAVATEAVGHLLRLHEAGAREGDGSPMGAWRERLADMLDPLTGRMPAPHAPPRELSPEDALVDEAAYYVTRIAGTVELHPDRADVLQALIDDAPLTPGGPDPALMHRVFIDAVLQRGREAQITGEYDDAKAWFRHAADAGAPDGHNELGNLLDDLGEHDAARAAWIAATEAGSGPAAGNLARFCEQHGDLAEAENWWRRAAELGLPDPPSRAAHPFA